MFESISFRSQNNTDINNPLDIGMLLECMLFYRTTNIIANPSILKQLLRDLGTEQILTLIEERILKILYTESLTGIMTNTITGGVQVHDTVIVSSPQHSFQDVIRRQCIELTGREGKGRRIAQRLENKITVIQHDELLTDGARKSLLDQEYLKKAVPVVIQTLIPGISAIDEFVFRTEKTPNGIIVNTNINFNKLNDVYNQINPLNQSSFRPSSILSHLFDAETDLYFSSTYLSELVTTPLSSRLMKEKLGYLVHKASKSRSDIEHFQNYVFGDAKALREAFNNKNVQVDDVISLILKSQKFKEWLATKEQNQDLVREYYGEVTRGTFIDKLPGKSARWAFFTTLGLAADAIATGGAGVAAGVALGALDTFFIDKLLRGWKPSQFIEEDVKKMVNKS